MRGSSIFRRVYVNQRWRWHPWIFEQYTHFPLAGSAFHLLRLLPLRPSFCIAALLIRPPVLGLGAVPAHGFLLPYGGKPLLWHCLSVLFGSCPDAVLEVAGGKKSLTQPLARGWGPRGCSCSSPRSHCVPAGPLCQQSCHPC